MSKPWQKYANTGAKPWAKYAKPQAPQSAVAQEPLGIMDPRLPAIQARTAQMGPLERLWKGAEYGADSVGAAVNQAGLHLGSALGIVSPQTAQNYDQIVNNQNYVYQHGLGQTFSGSFGSNLAKMAPTLPLMAVSAPAESAGAAANVVRSAVAGGLASLLQPTRGGSNSAYANQKLAQLEHGIELGGAIPLAFHGLARTAEALYPGNVAGRLSNFITKHNEATPYAKESEELGARTGIQFTPAQVSGSKFQNSMENLSRDSFFSKDLAFKADTKLANQADKYIGKLTSQLSDEPVSAQGVGTKIQSTLRGAVSSIAKQRAEVAARQYGAVNKLLGNTPVVAYTNTRKALNSLISELDDVPDAASSALRAKLETLANNIDSKPAYSLQSAQKFRTRLGKAAHGSADIFNDVKGGEQRRIASELYAAITQDMEDGANALDNGLYYGPGVMNKGTNAIMQPSRIGDLWKEANQNYKQFSQLIDGLQKSPLRHLLGDQVNIDDFMTVNKIPPETVVKKLSAMSPTEIGLIRTVMENKAPETWQEYKRLLVQDALDEAQTSNASAGANELPLNGTSFIKALGGDKPAKIAKLRATFTPGEFSQINDAFSALRRLHDRSGANFSGTAGAYDALRILRHGLHGIVGSSGEILGLRKVARLMLNANGRRSLIELSRLPPSSHKAAALAGYVSALASGAPVAKLPSVAPVSKVGANDKASKNSAKKNGGQSQ